MTRLFSDDDIAAIRDALLAFYDTAARPLPWRETRDPYAIWVSEVMSQQTRVDTVIPYYYSWLRAFPDVDALANASIDDVLKSWEGLGYYSRARNLHAAARVVRERYNGVVPDSPELLRELPGVGEYTAGAVSSIAFGERCAAVDGNVRRVIARLLDHPNPPAAMLRDVVLALVSPDRPGDFNQALMELGATICTPRSPSCRRCPVAAHCAAFAAGTQAERPLRRAKAPVPTIDIATAVLRDDRGRLLLAQRPASGLLAGLWCFPGEVAGPDAATRVLEVAARFAHVCAEPVALGTVTHVFSHRRERYHCFLIDVLDVVERDGAVWVDADDRSHAMPRGQQRIRQIAVGGGG